MSRNLIKELFFFPIRVQIRSIMATSDPNVSFNRETGVMARLLPLLLNLSILERHHYI